MLTDEKIAELSEAEKAATAGPCEKRLDEKGAWHIVFTSVPRGFHGACYSFLIHCDESDANFIALARNHMRELLDEVRGWRSYALKRRLDEKGLNIGRQLLKAPWEKENEKLRAKLKLAVAAMTMSNHLPWIASALKCIDESGLVK